MSIWPYASITQPTIRAICSSRLTSAWTAMQRGPSADHSRANASAWSLDCIEGREPGRGGQAHQAGAPAQTRERLHPRQPRLGLLPEGDAERGPGGHEDGGQERGRGPRAPRAFRRHLSEDVEKRQGPGAMAQVAGARPRERKAQGAVPGCRVRRPRPAAQGRQAEEEREKVKAFRSMSLVLLPLLFACVPAVKPPEAPLTEVPAAPLVHALEQRRQNFQSLKAVSFVQVVRKGRRLTFDNVGILIKSYDRLRIEAYSPLGLPLIELVWDGSDVFLRRPGEPALRKSGPGLERKST